MSAVVETDPAPADLSRDRLRLALFGERLPVNPQHERVLTGLLRKAVHECLGLGIPVQLTDTAAEPADQVEYARIADLYGVTLPGLPPAPQQVMYTPVETLPPVWIFDLDGTLCCNETGRGWYDMSRVWEDGQNPAVTAVLRAVDAAGFGFVVVTGRTEEGVPGSLAWFDRHQLPRPLHIYAKPAGSVPGTVADEQFKHDTFLAEIAPKYRVLGVFEDRNVVVDMWRRLGLTCFHVADGDF